MKLLHLCIALSMGIFSCTPNPVSYSIPTPTKILVMEGLAHPWSMAFINEDEAFLSEKDGNLLRVKLSTREKNIIQNFPEDLFTRLIVHPENYPPGTYPSSLAGKEHRGNAGILDVKLHPDFASNQQVFISYVAEREETYALKVIRAVVKDHALSEIKTVLTPGPYVPGLWHFGGGLLIQGDYLYVTAGERLFYEYVKEGLPIAQDLSDARGKIYRIHLDGSIPADNPHLGEAAVPGIYASGIRAAQGITANPLTGEIWFSEHGTIQGDELNVLQAGANYGWPNITSGKWRSPDYQPDSLPNPTYTDPKHYWLQTVAPTGLSFYTGKEFPSWKGNLIVPGLSRGSLWRMVLDGQTIKSAEELFMDDHVRSRKVVQSPDGHLYLLTDEDNGKIFRIINTKNHD